MSSSSGNGGGFRFPRPSLPNLNLRERWANRPHLPSAGAVVGGIGNIGRNVGNAIADHNPLRHKAQRLHVADTLVHGAGGEFDGPTGFVARQHDALAASHAPGWSSLVGKASQPGFVARHRHPNRVPHLHALTGSSTALELAEAFMHRRLGAEGDQFSLSGVVEARTLMAHAALGHESLKAGAYSAESVAAGDGDRNAAKAEAKRRLFAAVRTAVGVATEGEEAIGRNTPVDADVVRAFLKQHPQARAKLNKLRGKENRVGSTPKGWRRVFHEVVRAHNNSVGRLHWGRRNLRIDRFASLNDEVRRHNGSYEKSPGNYDNVTFGQLFAALSTTHKTVVGGQPAYQARLSSKNLERLVRVVTLHEMITTADPERRNTILSALHQSDKKGLARKTARGVAATGVAAGEGVVAGVTGVAAAAAAGVAVVAAGAAVVVSSPVWIPAAGGLGLGYWIWGRKKPEGSGHHQQEFRSRTATDPAYSSEL